jgi:rhodanese-related sulfurtransferase
MKPLNPDELKEWIEVKKPFLLLDVREPWEYDAVRLQGGVLVPLRSLAQHPPQADRSTPVVAYCHHGTRSLTACRILEQQGFQEVYNLTGGIDAFARKADRSLPRY